MLFKSYFRKLKIISIFSITSNCCDGTSKSAHSKWKTMHLYMIFNMVATYLKYHIQQTQNSPTKMGYIKEITKIDSGWYSSNRIDPVYLWYPNRTVVGRLHNMIHLWLLAITAWVYCIWLETLTFAKSWTFRLNISNHVFEPFSLFAFSSAVQNYPPILWHITITCDNRLKCYGTCQI